MRLLRCSLRGFTLIELLVVIAVIAIIAAILFPVFAQAKLQVSPAVTQFNLAPAKPWWEIVPALLCPVLLLTGDTARGAAITPEMAQEISSLNPRVQVVRLAGAGHNVRREQFDDYVRHMREFLGREPVHR